MTPWQARKRRWEGMARGRTLVGPQTVHIDLANGCNTNCTTCWDHSPLLATPRSAAWKRKIFDLERFVALARDLAGMASVESAILSGMGDPFVNPFIYDIIAECKRQGWHVTVLTNALLADPDRVAALGVDAMLVSVNGASPASYAAFHPNLRASDFERLKALLARWRALGVPVKHVQVINRDTAPELVEMVEFAARYGARQVTFKLASLGGGTEACAITEAQRVELRERLAPEAAKAATRLGVATNLDVFGRQLAADGLATTPIEEVGCFMGWHYARITVEGELLYCCAATLRVGHLDWGPFSAQWRGAPWEAMRARLMAGAYAPACRQCGKFNQNVKLAAKVRERLGEAAYRRLTGRPPSDNAQEAALSAVETVTRADGGDYAATTDD
ncbi:MAG: radical SAM protein [Chloracidobacterium sp. CP2_5A]|nr:MAG: radical SAM protein [Chloracidobacterium sp. CP2_5A]